MREIVWDAEKIHKAFAQLVESLGGDYQVCIDYRYGTREGDPKDGYRQFESAPERNEAIIRIGPTFPRVKE